MSKAQVLLFREDVAKEVSSRAVREYSGSIRTDGLFLANDTVPTSSTLNTGYTGLYDDDYSNASFTPVSSNYSFGVDLGTARKVKRITFFDDGTAPAGMYISGSNATLDVYYSSNNSSWTKIRSYRLMLRSAYSGSLLYTTMILPQEYEQRYWKCHCVNGGLMAGSGSLVQITQMVPTVRPIGRLIRHTQYVTHKATAKKADLVAPGESGQGTSTDPYADKPSNAV